MKSGLIGWSFFPWGWANSWMPMLVGGQGWGRCRQPIRVGLMRHPRLGTWLIDTGLHPRLLGGPWWVKLFCHFLEIPEGAPQVGPLNGIFLTHLHLDHVAGLRDFPDLPIICSRREMEGRRGYWWDLLPPDFEQRVRWIEEIPQGDLFGDGSVRAIPLPGHSPGMHGLLSEQLIYAADAAGHSHILQGLRRRRLSTLIASSRRLEAESMASLRQYPSHLPRVLAHCPLELGAFEEALS